VYHCYESDDLLYFDGIDTEKWELSSRIEEPKKGYLQINAYEVLPMM
jgi:hypothetical protein